MRKTRRISLTKETLRHLITAGTRSTPTSLLEGLGCGPADNGSGICSKACNPLL